MSARIAPGIAEAVVDDSDLTPDEMIAAAACGLNDPESWGAPGMDAFDQDESASLALP